MCREDDTTPGSREDAPRLIPDGDHRADPTSPVLDPLNFARELSCGLCGGPIARRAGKGRQRRYHDHCGRLVHDLARVERDLTDFFVLGLSLAGYLDCELSRLLVSRCMAVVNRIPRAFHARRDARGRFAPERREG